MEFFSQFMWDRDFQKSSVEYPININEIEIEKDSNWLHQDFYTSKSYMPILHFDTLTYFDKDIKEEKIKMCIVSFENDSGVNYSFSKKRTLGNFLKPTLMNYLGALPRGSSFCHEFINGLFA